MNEQIKLGLLGVIALTLIINTYYQAKEANEDEGGKKKNQQVDKPRSNAMGKKQNKASGTAPDFNQPDKKEPPKNTTSVEFDEYEHDFGTIKQQTTNKKVFSFTNTGEEPLVISNAKGSCGCTVPNYPKEPIAPGKTGDIEVVYKPGDQKGEQQKSVTITANTKPKQTVLNINAKVEPE